ncbi:hypothetical protein K431DRAFT_219906 [Polychaeton citri CBS 116435]|uniref:Bromo domain-containing protein n=1 Tax=Polychaeton citri CBS 116435 TaxID=1314669 RepID=A0A9P4QA43_9PEZI|nr:hypothetical protein K431DRAFT_219906 [Polychaeton citri CBS 116435]
MPTIEVPPKKAARVIDDDYGDDEDEEDEVEKESPLKNKTPHRATLPNGLVSSHTPRSPNTLGPSRLVKTSTGANGPEAAKSSEDVRKQHDEDKKIAAEKAKRSFQQMFYTFEHDRDAMLEQAKLDELDREVENEISGDASNPQRHGDPGDPSSAPTSAQKGSLGSADLGASSLTLKHLIARIDMKRHMVRASDNQLRTLISEVKRGRSKWASEDRVGQEELYEASEKVLMELKAMTDYAQPFLQRVSKREAPDYFNIIKTPMDIGNMIKKLKQFLYKSKKDFVDDLYLIWANALKYNTDERHPIRKKAQHMHKMCDKLVGLIPDIVVKDRAEVEAEERRLASLEAGSHVGDDSDEDDVPIKASRGRKAPKKGANKGGSGGNARKTPPTSNGSGAVSTEKDGTSTPGPPDGRPYLQTTASHLRNEFLRADSEAHDISSAGFSTPPPPGTATPLVNGASGHAQGSQADGADVVRSGQSTIIEDPDVEDADFKVWKQVTMKDRAQATSDRHKLFRGHNLNADEPALLRSKAGMRRWVRQQKLSSENESSLAADGAIGTDEPDQQAGTGDTLAEGIEQEEDSTLPDYYDSLSSIPELRSTWPSWVTDSEGFVVPQTEEWIRMFPRGHYVSNSNSHLSSKMEFNMRQMQDTRKVCAKIGIVKQMQIQAQTYQNQFQKYEPQPFEEADVGNVVVSEDGPLMAPWVNRAAFHRSVGKIFYHAGFEDFQPSALDAVTDIAGEYFRKLVEGYKNYCESPQLAEGRPRFTSEEQCLHALSEGGIALEGLELYVKDDVERLGTKLGVVHERMKAHLADLLRPALGDNAGADGVGAFNDGSDQFVGGDFAEDLDEDFFGFKELGLDQEFGLESLSVPLHLLQNRMHSAYQAQNNNGAVSSSGILFETPPQYDAITVENLPRQIGLVQDFFRNKLRANRDQSLVEDEELPQKQRFPKPRLPPTGKISSPRKRPLREQQQMAKKKRKLEEEKKEEANKIKPLKLQMPDRQSLEDELGGDPEKDGQVNGAMISPESITAN